MKSPDDFDTIMAQMDGLVDSYHALPSAPPLPTLIELRRELAVTLYRLSAHVKEVYKEKAISYIMRKYGVAREMLAAMEQDKAAAKKRPMNMLETITEALDGTLQNKKREALADATWEMLREKIRSTHQVLTAMSQEISDLKQEKSTTHYQAQGV